MKNRCTYHLPFTSPDPFFCHVVQLEDVGRVLNPANTVCAPWGVRQSFVLAWEMAALHQWVAFLGISTDRSVVVFNELELTPPRIANRCMQVMPFISEALQSPSDLSDAVWLPSMKGPDMGTDAGVSRLAGG